MHCWDLQSLLFEGEDPGQPLRLQEFEAPVRAKLAGVAKQAGQAWFAERAGLAQYARKEVLLRIDCIALPLVCMLAGVQSKPLATSSCYTRCCLLSLPRLQLVL